MDGLIQLIQPWTSLMSISIPGSVTRSAALIGCIGLGHALLEVGKYSFASDDELQSKKRHLFIPQASFTCHQLSHVQRTGGVMNVGA